jgi:hypothetical protein
VKVKRFPAQDVRTKRLLLPEGHALKIVAEYRILCREICFFFGLALIGKAQPFGESIPQFELLHFDYSAFHPPCAFWLLLRDFWSSPSPQYKSKL